MKLSSRVIQQTKAQQALARMRRQAALRELDRLPGSAVRKEIRAARLPLKKA